MDSEIHRIIRRIDYISDTDLVFVGRVNVYYKDDALFWVGGLNNFYSTLLLTFYWVVLIL